MRQRSRRTRVHHEPIPHRYSLMASIQVAMVEWHTSQFMGRFHAGLQTGDARMALFAVWQGPAFEARVAIGSGKRQAQTDMGAWEHKGVQTYTHVSTSRASRSAGLRSAQATDETHTSKTSRRCIPMVAVAVQNQVHERSQDRRFWKAFWRTQLLEKPE